MAYFNPNINSLIIFLLKIMPMKKDEKAAVSEERPASLAEAVKAIRRKYKEDLN